MGTDTQKRDWFSTEDSEDSDLGHGSGSESENEVKRSAVKKVVKEVKKSKPEKSRKRKVAAASEDDDEDEEEKDVSRAKVAKRKTAAPVFEFGKRFESSEDEDEDDDGDDDEQDEDSSDEVEHMPGASSGTDGDVKDVLRRLSTKELEDNRARIEKTGVVYLSRIPPFMKPGKVRQILSRFGELDRIFLAPEDPKSYARRVRFGGNKKRNFVEGWVEFKDKKKAKLCASTLNGQIIGGNKRSYYYDDILNIKYLPKFKWHNLTEQIAYENQVRQAKLRAEISQATRENKAYIRNVGRAKMIENIKAKRALKAEAAGANEDASTSKKQGESEIEMRRNFRQRTVRDRTKSSEPSARDKANEAAMQRVLGSIFS
ncbi:hypothetical protein BZA70DRAFT_179653 [Myxozyma melibiosi]|uniref:Pre-rRNA-processing protein ESF2 n=1 Tax=Myxozyma melibiosi TaxID=54550 RepID=A0ABR1F6C8_9ASCO